MAQEEARKRRRTRKKNPPKKGSRAAKRGARKAARTRATNRARRSAAARKAARTRKRRHGGGRVHRKTTRRSHRTSRRPARRRKSHRKSPKRVAAGRKAAATRKARRARLSGDLDYKDMAFEGHRRRRKRRKNPAAAAPAGAAEARRKRRKSHRKSPKRVAAGRKAARTRKRRGHVSSRRRSHKRKRPGHRRHHVRGHSRRGKGGRRIRVRGHMSHEEARRKRSRKRNPIDGWKEMLSGVVGVGVGAGLASLTDRLLSTHALNSQGQDAPAQGQLYNSESMSLPIWSSWGRLGGAVGSVAVPLFIASKVRSAGWKTFFQLAGFGAMARGAGKVLDDGMGYIAGQTQNPMLVQLYSPEIAASTALATSSLTAPAAATPGTFAAFMGRLLGVGAGSSKRLGPDMPPAGYQCPPGYQYNPDTNRCVSASGTTTLVPVSSSGGEGSSGASNPGGEGTSSSGAPTTSAPSGGSITPVPLPPAPGGCVPSAPTMPPITVPVSPGSRTFSPLHLNPDNCC